MARKQQNTNNGCASIIGIVFLIVIVIGFFSGGGSSHHSRTPHQQNTMQQASSRTQVPTSSSEPVNDKSAAPQQPSQPRNDLSQLNFQGQQIVQVNNGQPNFTSAQLSTNRGAWATYQPLDNLGRATGASGLLNKSLMPHTKRERLVVNPTGFRNRKVQMNGHMEWLYNRSHLIGYQFTGQNNNLQNLVTGTRSLNDPGMSHYENMVAMYLRSHPDDYVRYQITPVYRESELVPRGVQMQAESINSQTIRFNIYIFNIQPGIDINYQNGYSSNK